jgi:hypothetical protein
MGIDPKIAGPFGSLTASEAGPPPGKRRGLDEPRGDAFGAQGRGYGMGR